MFYSAYIDFTRFCFKQRHYKRQKKRKKERKKERMNE